MRIRVNGEDREVASDTLAGALEELGYGGAAVATALNEGFVPKAGRDTATLSPGDRVEIVAPRQGG